MWQKDLKFVEFFRLEWCQQKLTNYQKIECEAESTKEVQLQSYSQR